MDSINTLHDAVNTPSTDVSPPKEEDTLEVRSDAHANESISDVIGEEREVANIPQTQTLIYNHLGQDFEVPIKKPTLPEIAEGKFAALRHHEQVMYLTEAAASLDIEKDIEAVAGVKLEESEKRKQAEEFYNIVRTKTGEEIQKSMQKGEKNPSHQGAAALVIVNLFKEDPKFIALKEKDPRALGTFITWAGANMELIEIAENRDRANRYTARERAIEEDGGK